MNKKYLQLIALLFILGCNSTEKTNENSKTESKASTVEIDFSKAFEGAINEQHKIMMKIKSTDGKIRGSYFYTNIGIEISLTGTLDNSGNIKLEEFDAKGKRLGSFEGRLINNNKISGDWFKKIGAASMPFLLLESQKPYEMTRDRISDQTYKSISGYYVSPNNSDDFEAGVKINYLGKNKFKFEVATSNGRTGCTGEISQIGVINTYGVGSYSDKLCESLNFKFEPSKVTISETNCQFHGARCTFNGTYIRMRQ